MRWRRSALPNSPIESTAYGMFEPNNVILFRAKDQIFLDFQWLIGAPGAANPLISLVNS